MKVTGIIAEYNPFHNGHKYQLDQARSLTNADYLIVVMSGDFTQRGAPALIDKYSRTKMALEGGADLVIELPVYYAAASAEYFSNGAISILHQLGIVDSVCFGSECGDIDVLYKIANILANEPAAFKALLQDNIKGKMTFPQARNITLESLYPEIPNISDILSSPNNILGIEYIKAIIRMNSSIVPYTNLRVGSDYHDKRLAQNNSSAIAIRHSLMDHNELSHIEDQVPVKTFEILKEEYKKTYPIFHDDISGLLKYKLLLEKELGYTSYVDVSRELSDRICNSLNSFHGFDDFSMMLKTKDITYTRVCRSLLHILLNLKQDILDSFVSNDYCYYARVLGFKETSLPLLNKIKNSTSIPLISKLADANSLLGTLGNLQLESDLLAAHVYQSILSEKFNRPMMNEYERRILKI
ncbi:MAG TPA: nucleotidyltransferase [Lachnospiraceae bacterium]|nr:nucleotidyltransferase [Lachnospiraceae bacterium]